MDAICPLRPWLFVFSPLAPNGEALISRAGGRPADYGAGWRWLQLFLMMGRMDGETNLTVLLRTMRPALHPGEFVFCAGNGEVPAGLNPIATFREREGLTVICQRAEAERAGWAFSFPCRMITLQVHSGLDAIGLLAAVTGELARHGIAVNAISAYYHDHLFVPVERAAEAMDVLTAQSASHSTGVTGSSSAQQTMPSR